MELHLVLWSSPYMLVCVVLGLVLCRVAMTLERYSGRYSCERHRDRHPACQRDPVTVIKSVSISTFPNVHFAVHLRQRLTLSNTFLTKPLLNKYVWPSGTTCVVVCDRICAILSVFVCLTLGLFLAD